MSPHFPDDTTVGDWSQPHCARCHHDDTDHDDTGACTSPAQYRALGGLCDCPGLAHLVSTGATP